MFPPRNRRAAYRIGLLESRAVRYLVWDFDGTLAHRPGLWSGTLADILRQHLPETTATLSDFRPHMSRGFPWHTPDVGCDPPRSADEWWACLQPHFEEAFRSVGSLRAEDAARLAGRVRAG